MVQTVTNTFYNRTGEGGQGPGKEDKERDKACPDAGHLQGSPMANPEFLKDKAQGKCLICRHWTKGSKLTNLLKQLATNAISWDFGQHLALGTQEPQGQAPSLPS